MTENCAVSDVVVVWECHRSCDESCLHQLPEGKTVSREREFSSWEGHSLVREIAELHPRRFVLGGDTLGRKDILQLVDLARRTGIAPWVSVTPSERLRPVTIDALGSHGAAGLVFPLESADATEHDRIVGLEGSFEFTADAIVNARLKGLKVEIVTNLWEHNFDQLEAIADYAEDLDVQRWTIFLPVPTLTERFDLPTAAEVEALWERLESIDDSTEIEIEIEEGQMYRRHRLQHWIEARRNASAAGGNVGPKPVQGRPHETLFISHVGEAYLGNQMTLTGGNAHFETLEQIYSESPVFRMLRDRSLLVGKCRSCEFNGACGGSRARALAMTGDPMEGDPLCLYQPGRLASAVRELG